MDLNTLGTTSLSNTELIIPPAVNVTELGASRLNKNIKSTDITGNHLYGFMLVLVKPGDLTNLSTSFSDMQDYSSEPGASLISGGRASAPNQYFFRVAPQSVAISEPMTVTIKPMQNGSYVTEHHGSLMKKLAISGTTGFRPEYMSSKSSFVDERGLPPDEVTGHFNFIQLLNLFRKYAYLRRYVKERRSFIGDRIPMMLWVDMHRFEFWICEPASFSSHQTSKSPVSFFYGINAVLLRKYDSIVFRKDNFVTQWVDDILGKVGDALNYCNNFLNTANSVARKSADNYGGIGLASSIYSGVNQIVTSVSNLSASAENLFKLPLETLDKVDTDTSNFLDSLYDTAMGTGARYNSVFYEMYKEADVFQRIKKSIRRMKSARTDFYTKSSYNNPSASMFNKYNSRDSINSRDGLGSGLYDPSMILDSGVDDKAGKPVWKTVLGSEDIQTFALRTTGNASNWMSIVLLNGLRPPYISRSKDRGIAQPGDALLVPSNSLIEQDSKNAVLPTQDYDLSRYSLDVNSAEVIFGRDLKLVNSSINRNNQLYDLEVTSGGDIAIIEGVDNFIQAMVLVTRTEKGSLKYNPSYGTEFIVGIRAGVSMVALWGLTVKQAILSDPRVASVDRVNVSFQGDTVVISIDITTLNVITKVPLVISRRF